MSGLADVIVRLDSLSAAELQTVVAVCGARMGQKLPPSSPGDPPERPGASVPVGGKQVKPVATAAEVTVSVTPAAPLPHGALAAMKRLVSAVKLMLDDIPPGIGRKGIINSRLSTLRDAWQAMPTELRNQLESL